MTLKVCSSMTSSLAGSPSADHHELLPEVGLLVGEVGVVPELHVGRGEGLAVGPLVALAQMERVLGRLGIDLVALGDVGGQARPVRREADQRLVALVAHEHRQRAAADQRVVPVAALLAGRVERRDRPGDLPAGARRPAAARRSSTCSCRHADSFGSAARPRRGSIIVPANAELAARKALRLILVTIFLPFQAFRPLLAILDSLHLPIC